MFVIAVRHSESMCSAFKGVQKTLVGMWVHYLGNTTGILETASQRSGRNPMVRLYITTSGVVGESLGALGVIWLNPSMDATMPRAEI